MSNAAATATVATKHHVVKQSSLDKGEKLMCIISSIRVYSLKKK